MATRCMVPLAAVLLARHDNARMAKRNVARKAKAPSLQESADSLGAVSPRSAPPSGDLADVWKSLAGLGVPAQALVEAQREYIAEATSIWNRLLMPPAA